MDAPTKTATPSEHEMATTQAAPRPTWWPWLLALALLCLLAGATTWLVTQRQASSDLPLWVITRPEWRQLQQSLPAKRILVPVKGITRRQVANTYGAPRPGGRKHEGLDIFAPTGTPIIAAAPGLVLDIGSNSLGGLVVTVVGHGNRRYYYAHLSRYGNIEEGAWVNAGMVLGYVGKTGNAANTPPHLHFGVYGERWQALNPYSLLQDRLE
jgi:peptidoglycan LD-endopeptidase LytH